MRISEDHLLELYEIADGAYGDGPWVRGLAIKHIQELGYKYPRQDSRNDVALSSAYRKDE